MIKRRFYKQDHADRNDATDSSSSSEDSDADSVEEEEEEEITETKEEEEEQRPPPRSPSSGSGYESEDSSGNEVDCDSTGLVNEDDDSSGNGTRQSLKDSLATHKVKTAEEVPNNAAKASKFELDDYALKCKSVFKCRLCPRIVCLTEETLKAHLNSKRHARSKKLLREGRLKFMLNSDGEIEEDQETHAERHARIIGLTQDSANPKKKNKGRQRQKLRLLKKKLRDGSQREVVKRPTKIQTKKKRKTED